MSLPSIGGSLYSHLLYAGLLALAAASLLTPLVCRLALATGWVDRPGPRRIHTSPVPTGGGIGIYAGFWLATWALAGLDHQLVGLLVSSTVILVVGLVDDRRPLSPAAKLAGQLVAAGLLVWFGIRIDFLTNPLGGMIYLGLWGVPLTVLWLVAITNMINFIDGLDGLAAGMAAIACVPLLVIAIQKGQMTAALLTVAMAGSTIGFLPYNFNPARIFMGDAGGMFVGFVLAAIAVLGALKGPTTVALLIPIAALGVPVVDGIYTVVRRFLAGRPIYQADNTHVHHRLLARGLNQRQAVLLLYAVSGALAGGALLLAAYGLFKGMVLVVLAGMASVTLARWLGVVPQQPPARRVGG